MTDPSAPYDLLVIGGGINGTGIAADAAGRGLRVALCEQGDLGSATSSASTKLIHGGLRYLEQFEFSLVRRALRERECLMAAAPHLIHPLAFRIPWVSHLRPRWVIRCGLFLYDHLTPCSLPPSRLVRLGHDSPLAPDLTQAFEYWDAQVDDSRLVVLNAVQAAARGAIVLPRTQCTALREEAGGWRATLRGDRGGAAGGVNGEADVRAGAVVNATGPWVNRFLEGAAGRPGSTPVRLVKGSHLVLPRLYPGNQAYLLQHTDKRVVFVIPWFEHWTLVGTTEEPYAGDPSRAAPSEAETAYLLEIINRYFNRRVSRDSVLAGFSGVRPLVGEHGGQSRRISRDYRLILEEAGPPLLSIYGGKVTTYRLLAERALALLAPRLPPMGPAWTASAPLPGGDFPGLESLLRALADEYPWAAAPTLRRWAASYGTRTRDLLGGAAGPGDLGRDFGHGLTEREVDYLRREEWAASTEDILWRRSKLGLRFEPAQVRALENYLRDAT